MIGDIQQCYSRRRYEEPADVRPGMFLEKGRPKSLYRPGSSTDVLIFEPDRVRLDADLVANQLRCDGTSRFTSGFRRPLLETEVAVRTSIGRCASRPVAAGWPTSGVGWPTHPYPAPIRKPAVAGETVVSADASEGKDGSPLVEAARPPTIEP
jgi:hypothetical protein